MVSVRSDQMLWRGRVYLCCGLCLARRIKVDPLDRQVTCQDGQKVKARLICIDQKSTAHIARDTRPPKSCQAQS